MLSNAIKFSHEGSKIKVKLTEFDVKNKEQNLGVNIVIQDFGIGISF